jgi:hypothetical protein
MTTSGVFLSKTRIYFLSDIPPIIDTLVSPWTFSKSKCFCIYKASSRVGVRISAPGYPQSGRRRSRIGSRNHNVFPLPVFDAMIRSYQLRTPAGTQIFCIPVGEVNPFEPSAVRIAESVIPSDQLPLLSILKPKPMLFTGDQTALIGWIRWLTLLPQ